MTLHRQHVTEQPDYSTAWTPASDRTAINELLQKYQTQQQVPSASTTNTTNTNTSLRLRLATVDDLETIERLVMGLAEFEKEPESVQVTKEHYRRDGFSSDEPPLFSCLLLEHVKPDDTSTNNKSNDVYVCGMALCFFGYSFGEGRFLFLEDLFIEKEFRGMGGGTLLMQVLAEIAESTHCIRAVWHALYWNTPALTFYNKIGARVVDGLLTSRFAGDGLKTFHNDRSVTKT